MPRPFTALKALDLDALSEEVLSALAGGAAVSEKRKAVEEVPEATVAKKV
jgi:hypothetical protein